MSTTNTAANSSAEVDFLYLSEPDMVEAGVMDMPACIDAMEETFRLLHAGDYRMAGVNNDSHGAMIEFPEHSPFADMPKPTADRRFMAMPAYLGGKYRMAGVKWYGSNVANRDQGLPRSILMMTLNDADTGAPVAHMSANILSAYRTGAVPGVGARWLARADSHTVGILGPGVMARTALLAFVAACPQIDLVKVKGRSAAGVVDFSEWVGQNLPNLRVETVESVEEVVRNSDIVTYCTSGETGDPSTYPIVKREWVKPGAFISLPSLANIDEGMQQPDVRKVMDNRGLYEAWAAEAPKPTHAHVPIIGCKFLDMVDQGVIDSDELSDLGDVVSRVRPGRESEEQIVVLSVGGMPVEDVAWGTEIYRRARAAGIGTQLRLWDAPLLR